MDLAAEYYLQTVDTVFVRHALPKGEMTHRGAPVDLGKIRRVALMTVEGEHDDISGVGQTEAAQRLLVNLPDDLKTHWLQPAVGHYGVFNRFALPRRDRAAHFRFRAVQQFPPRRLSARGSRSVDVAPAAGSRRRRPHRGAGAALVVTAARSPRRGRAA